MANEQDIEFDVVINGKQAKLTLEDLKKAQDGLDKNTEKTTNNMKKNWVGVGVAITASIAAATALASKSIELERNTFNLTKTTKEYIRVTSDSLGVNQKLIAGFVQTGKSAGLSGQAIDDVIKKSVALSRAFPHESVESFVDNLVMLNRTGEAQGFIVDILEQKYGAVDLKAISLADKLKAVEEATKGVNKEFSSSAVGEYDKSLTILDNTLTDMGNDILRLLENSGAFTLFNKALLLGSTSLQGLLNLANLGRITIKNLFGGDVTEDIKKWEKDVLAAKETLDELTGAAEKSLTVTVKTTKDELLPDIKGKVKPKEQIEVEAAAGREILNNKKKNLDSHVKDYDNHIREKFKKEVDINRKIEREFQELNLSKFDIQRLRLAREFEEEQKHAHDIEKLNEVFAGKLRKIHEEEKEELEELKKAGMETANAIGDSFANAFDTQLENALINGKASFKDFTNSVLLDIARIVRQQAINKPLSAAISTGINALFSNTGSTTTVASAKGNTFDGSSNITRFAQGGVMSRPTKKPLSGGATGLFAERNKKEGAFPLTQMSNGDLGVQAEIGGGSGESIQSSATIIIQAIDTQTGTEFLIKNKSLINDIIVESVSSGSKVYKAIKQSSL